MNEPPPPWTVFPSLTPAVAPNQGAEEAYVVLEWLPFWQALTPERRQDYLDRWQASGDWRDTVACWHDPDFDVEADARDAAKWAAAHPIAPRTGWRRWFGRR